MIKIIFLGTSAMVPTKERNHSALLLIHDEESMLFDCGEGTQRQLRIAGISPATITRVYISHWHGDHVLGLPGLMQTMGMNNYEKTLKIYGPKGTKQHVNNIYKAFSFEKKISVEIHEAKKGEITDEKKFWVYAEKLQHSVECLGFKFIEKDTRKIELEKARKLGLSEGPLLGELQSGKTINFKGKKIKPDDVSYVKEGKKIGLIFDTAPCNGALAIAKDVDLLICEATFATTLENKGELYGHMTAKQAAQLASQANSKKLIMTHFSQRYKDVDELLQEAKTIFENTICAYDFLKINL